MADIELVIKIPEEKYNKIISSYQGSKVRPKDYEIAIINGTPLPKGHGNLVDVEEVKEYLNNIQLELDGWGETDNAIEIAKARMGLDTVSTIIKAEKEDDNIRPYYAK